VKAETSYDVLCPEKFPELPVATSTTKKGTSLQLVEWKPVPLAQLL
jgi:hypothetical protein